MAGKKPAAKARKTTKPAAARTAARKPAAAHRAEPRKAPASTRRTGAASREAARAPSRVETPKATAAARPAKPAAAPRAAAVAPAAKPAPVKAPVPAKPFAPPMSKLPSGPIAVAVARAPRAPEGEEADPAEPGSLLAGPRNVKPYIAKRGEQYMGKLQLSHFQQILASWKRDLMEEVDRTVSHMKDEAANFPDPNDRATQEEEFSLELRTRDRERKLIRKIEEALKRIEDGSYGYCLETGEEIGIKRLEARPVATLSIEAQERRERRERQYGDRDDRYR
jgi:DnaK suppressor protein